ncbi:MAG: HPr-rel-A system PqqD family peptide chaperone [Novosphingobium sp.]
MSAIRKVHDRFAETVIDDEAVVMDLDSGQFYSLSGTALAVWRLVDGARGRSELIAELADRFGTRPAEIAADVDAFLDELSDAGLICAGT